MPRHYKIIDGNEAAASVAHRVSDVIAIYPITPATPMGELADAWSAAQRRNIFGQVPEVIEMQSEGGAAGAVHGALQGGALATTFTASQGLLLMIPNLYKIAGELTPAVIHVAARTVATHALSIFGDHSDVMACRPCGWAMLCSSSVQEVHDLALIAHAATLQGRVPVLHFFDGFRTSHELSKIDVLDDDDLRALIDEDKVRSFRQRALDPDTPVLRGSAQNPDVFFQAREAANSYYDAFPSLVQQRMDKFALRTGRSYRLFDYVGHPEAERVVVMMGSGVGAVEETVAALTERGEKVGLIKVRLFRPFDAGMLIAAVPRAVRSIAVLDRTKEPGALGEPLYQDVATALLEAQQASGSPQPLPKIIAGRYGLASKEFTPAMAASVFEEMAAPRPKNHFTIGIRDDVTHLSLGWNPDFSTESRDSLRAVLYGLGSDGTVGAVKSSTKIIGESTPLFVQGYSVYDSKKSGSVTISHVRVSPHPIRATYLIERANFVSCHQFHFLSRIDVLAVAERGACLLLNSPFGPEEVWDHLPVETQEQMIEKGIRLYVMDAQRIADEAGLAGRINTVMQIGFFALTGFMSVDEAIPKIKDSIAVAYRKRGAAVLEQNYAAVDAARLALHAVVIPPRATSTFHREDLLLAHRSHREPFADRVTTMLMAGKGDLLPVSAMPVDGTFPTNTARWEKRSIAHEIPRWDPSLCIQCGLCALVCPHSAVRMKAYPPPTGEAVPASFQSMPYKAKEAPGFQLTIQVAPDDCTGCGVCVDVCPAKGKDRESHKALEMTPKEPLLTSERANWDFFLGLPEFDRSLVKLDSVKGSQLLLPLFEFSGACAGCGETPYLKLLSQLFGDRAIIANATGCSSIFGGSLPTTPWAKNAEGRGPAWCNSLFEDNAEFGLGLRLAVDQRRRAAEDLLRQLAPELGSEWVRELIEAEQRTEAQIAAQRARVALLLQRLKTIDSSAARNLETLAEVLVERSLWIVGGDGWAYDIGFGGLDHVLAGGRKVNVLVLDTQVYSNTGGQASKATPRMATAKFASGGKSGRKKDLALMAVTYGDVYVAQVAIGANPAQALRAFVEAESYPGPSLILAYSHCIAHDINMATSMTHQRDVVQSGLWPLFRYDPRDAHQGRHPFHLDSHRPTSSFETLASEEGRFASLARSDPQHARELFELAQQDIQDRWHWLEQMARMEREIGPATTATHHLAN